MSDILRSSGSIRRPTKLDVLLLIMLAIIWASAFLAIKIVVPETGPLWLATIRVVIAFLFLLPFALYKGIIWPVSMRDWRLISVIMMLNVVVPFFLISWAELYIDAGVASLLMGVGPFLALVGSHFTTLDDRLSGTKLIGAACGFTGVLVLVGWDAVYGLGENLLGQLATILASACYVTSSLMLRKISGYPPLRLSTLILGMATILMLILSYSLVGLPDQSYSSQGWLGLVYLGVFPSAIGYIMRYYLIQKVGVSVFSVSINLIPVFGVVLGAVFLGEALKANVFLALALIVIGLLFVRRGIR